MGADGRVSLCSEIQSNDGKLMGRANKTSLFFAAFSPAAAVAFVCSFRPLFFPGVQWQKQVSFYESGKHQGSCCQAIITTRLPPPSSATAKKSSPPPVAVVATVSFLPLSDFCLRLRRHSTFPLPFLGPTFKVSLDRSLDFLQNNYSSFLYLQGDRRNPLPLVVSHCSPISLPPPQVHRQAFLCIPFAPSPHSFLLAASSCHTSPPPPFPVAFTGIEGVFPAPRKISRPI